MKSKEGTSNKAPLGDVEAEDLAEDAKTYYSLNQLVVDGFKCPDQFIDKLTPMEFEEMVGLFVSFDTDGSKTIDKHEAKKLLQYIDVEVCSPTHFEIANRIAFLIHLGN